MEENKFIVVEPGLCGQVLSSDENGILRWRDRTKEEIDLENRGYVLRHMYIDKYGLDDNYDLD